MRQRSRQHRYKIRFTISFYTKARISKEKIQATIFTRKYFISAVIRANKKAPSKAPTVRLKINLWGKLHLFVQSNRSAISLELITVGSNIYSHNKKDTQKQQQNRFILQQRKSITDRKLLGCGTGSFPFNRCSHQPNGRQ